MWLSHIYTQFGCGFLLEGNTHKFFSYLTQSFAAPFGAFITCTHLTPFSKQVGMCRHVKVCVFLCSWFLHAWVEPMMCNRQSIINKHKINWFLISVMWLIFIFLVLKKRWLPISRWFRHFIKNARILTYV